MGIEDKFRDEIKEIFKGKILTLNNINEINNIIKNELAKEKRPVA
ncbi:hypothetical protein [Clostridium omnivorum]|uniref:Uncharacterized protein n=1 Tax=Clostridium omnivorum TaxID=1604902 RepID=A0ABQ5NCT7_9CLOT|nr:hypothetical protein [Clostridium sp. E14]GLC32886.1 hypothetical protein bsdE14_42960 [Clostridium sp. E14]